MQRHGFLQARGDFVERRAERSVDHRRDVAGHSIGEILLVERAQQKDRLLYAGVTKRVGFVKLDDGETVNFGLGLEELSNVDDTSAVAVVLDDGENGPAVHAARDFLNVVTEIFSADFDPRIVS